MSTDHKTKSMREAYKTKAESKLRAGDRVKHLPTGETWELACDEERGQVMPSGWPPTIAAATDCELIEAATDEVRLDTLRMWADEGLQATREGDLRAVTARGQLQDGKEAK